MNPSEIVIRTQSDLLAAWRGLMQPLGFADPAIWLMLIDADGRPAPQLIEIADATEPPDAEQAASFAQMLGHLVDEETGGRWAILRARPGRQGVDACDRAWGSALVGACRAAGVPTDVMHLATDDRIVPLPIDDLALPA